MRVRCCTARMLLRRMELMRAWAYCRYTVVAVGVEHGLVAAQRPAHRACGHTTCAAATSAWLHAAAPNGSARRAGMKKKTAAPRLVSPSRSLVNKQLAVTQTHSLALQIMCSKNARPCSDLAEHSADSSSRKLETPVLQLPKIRGIATLFKIIILIINNNNLI